MPRFAANLSMMFTEVPFLDRFDAAAQAGFTAVEFLFPYEHPAEAIGERLKRNGLTQALFNLPPGDWNAGEKGFAALPARFDDLKASASGEEGALSSKEQKFSEQRWMLELEKEQQKLTRVYNLISNIMKASHDTQMNAIRNMR